MAETQRGAPYALVVDDNPVILLNVADLLEDIGFSTFAAPDSNIALDCLCERVGQFAVLFTNVHIPGPLNGFALARYVAERWPSMGIIVSSGHSHPTDDAMPRGAVFVSKPFTSIEVQDAVRQVVCSKDFPSWTGTALAS